MSLFRQGRCGKGKRRLGRRSPKGVRAGAGFREKDRDFLPGTAGVNGGALPGRRHAMRVGAVEVHCPALPNRTGGCPASGFPVGGALSGLAQARDSGRSQASPQPRVGRQPADPGGAGHDQVQRSISAQCSGAFGRTAFRHYPNLRERDGPRPRHDVSAVHFPLLSTQGCRPDAVSFECWPSSVGQVRDFHAAAPVRSQAHERGIYSAAGRLDGSRWGKFTLRHREGGKPRHLQRRLHSCAAPPPAHTERCPHKHAVLPPSRPPQTCFTP